MSYDDADVNWVHPKKSNYMGEFGIMRQRLIKVVGLKSLFKKLLLLAFCLPFKKDDSRITDNILQCVEERKI